MNLPLRGRSAQSNSDGRFSELRYEADGGALDAALEEVGGDPPGPLTQFLPDATLAELVHGNDQDLFRAFESRHQLVWLGKIAPPDAHTPLCQFLGFFRIADGDTDPSGRDEFEQLFGDGLAKLAVGSGNDDHDNLLCQRLRCYR